MGVVIVSLKIMPKGVNTNLNKIERELRKEVNFYGGKIEKLEVEPLAFGLKSLKVLMIMGEEKGGTDPLEDKIKKIEGVSSVEVVDVRRAIG